MEDVKPHEYKLLDEIAQDPLVTQAGLSSRLGIAVGSVNWYIKRLIQRGWIKVSHLDRTRLKYDLTSKGMRVFKRYDLHILGNAFFYPKRDVSIVKAYKFTKEQMGNFMRQDGI